MLLMSSLLTQIAFTLKILSIARALSILTAFNLHIQNTNLILPNHSLIVGTRLIFHFLVINTVTTIPIRTFLRI